MNALRTIAVVAWVLAAASGTHAGAAGDMRLREDMARLLKRVERLEQDNRELRDALKQAEGADRRLRVLEQSQAESEKALATERISEREPELVTRLKAVETQALQMQKQARQIEAMDGVTVSASLTGVAQSLNAAASTIRAAQSRLNWRGDVSVSLPGGDMGDIDAKLFAHFRLGQGAALPVRSAYSSTVNSTAFGGDSNPGDASATLAQGWYQLSIPLPRDGIKIRSKQRLVINAGKMDPFLFFDQNAIADDETIRFLNSAFVHNPLLDSGGDIGADAHGFAPGARIAYVDTRDAALAWTVSLGVFAASQGANFSGSPDKPFTIVQLEASPRFVTGLAGSYRAYAWRNPAGGGPRWVAGNPFGLRRICRPAHRRRLDTFRAVRTAAVRAAQV